MAPGPPPPAVPLSTLGFSVPPVNATDVHFADSRALHARVFTAPTLVTQRFWNPPAYLPPERRFALLGLGLCPLTPSAPSSSRPRRAPRFWQSKLKEPGLLGCLARCSNEPRCQAVAFSQRRSECVMQQEGCQAAALSAHVSYATFLHADDEAARAAVGERVRIPIAGGRARAAEQEEEGAGDVLRVYASSSPRVRVVLDAFISSLQLADEPAELFLYNASLDDTMRNESEEELNRAWPMTVQDYSDMRVRDRRKVNSVVRAVWEAFGAGARHVLVSDIDIQVFPGWVQLVRGCADDVQLCLMQQEGLFGNRRKPFNSGFLAFRADVVSVGLALDLAASYERQFLWDDNQLIGNYRIEQDVLSDYLAGPALGLWALFSPFMVRIFVDPTPGDYGRLKVQHACGSNAGNRLLGLYRTRRMYYSLAPLCVWKGLSGPQHPCCRLACWTPSIYETDVYQPPPWMKGAIYGQIRERPFCSFAADEEVLRFWLWQCEELRNERMAEWMEANPEEDFLQGRS